MTSKIPETEIQAPDNKNPQIDPSQKLDLSQLQPNSPSKASTHLPHDIRGAREYEFDYTPFFYAAGAVLLLALLVGIFYLWKNRKRIIPEKPKTPRYVIVNQKLKNQLPRLEDVV